MEKGDRVFIHQDIRRFGERIQGFFTDNVGWIVRKSTIVATGWIVENIDGKQAIFYEDEFTLLD